jgi:hypothetical protein
MHRKSWAIMYSEASAIFQLIPRLSRLQTTPFPFP